MTRGETRVSDSEGVRTKERKSESLLWELWTNQWGGKKNIIRELYFRGEEKHGEKRDERQIERERERERSMTRGETRISDNEGLRREKVKEREKKLESLLWEREGAKKLYFLLLQMNIIFIRDATHKRDYFPIFFF